MSTQEKPDSGETFWDTLGCLVYFFENSFDRLLDDPPVLSAWLLSAEEHRQVDGVLLWLEAKGLSGLAKRVEDEYRVVITEADKFWRKFRDADGHKGPHRKGAFCDFDQSVVANQGARFVYVLRGIQSNLQRQLAANPAPASNGHPQDEPKPKRNRGKPKEYSEEHGAACREYFQKWRTFYAEWLRDGKKGSARRGFAKLHNMTQKKSDAMIRYGTPQRKRSRAKSRRKRVK